MSRLLLEIFMKYRTVLYSTEYYCVVQDIIDSVQYAGAVFQIWQIKSHQIMVLDRIRVALANERTEIGNQGRLLFGGGGLQYPFKAPVIANCDEEDAATCRIEGSRFEIELEAMEVVIGHPTKKDPAGEHEILFDGANAVVGVSQG